MGLRDWFKRQPDPAVDLREALFAAVERSDQRPMGDLCRRYREEILRQFPTWNPIPDATRADPSALKRYAAGMIAVAAEFAGMGDRQGISDPRQ
jgi:hypothetical protein